MNSSFAAQSPKAGGGLSEAEVNALIAAYAAPLVHTHAASAIVSGTLDNARVNWAAPSALGSDTPAAVTGTTGRFNSDLTLAGAPGKIKPAANSTSALQVAQADGTAFAWWDTTNLRLGIGRIPTVKLDVYQNSASDLNAIVGNAGGPAYFQLQSGTTQYAANFFSIPSAQWLFGHFGSLNFVIRDHLNGTNVVVIPQNPASGGILMAKNLEVTRTDALTNAITDVLTRRHNTSGTATAGFGNGTLDTLESSTTENLSAGRDRIYWLNATHLTRESRRVDSVYNVASEVDVLGQTIDGVDISDTQAFHFGRPDAAGDWADGIWRMIRSGNDLVIQRRESAAWVTKSTIAA